MQKKEVYISLLVFILVIFFVSSCTQQGNVSSNVSEENTTLVLDNITQDSKMNNGSCNPNWICIGSQARGFQEENCKLTKRETCKGGCVNGTCQVSTSTCVSGFKCRNANERGYQQEDCSWISRKKCEFGCENSECVEEGVNSSNSTLGGSNEEETAPPAPSYETLKLGEEKVFVKDEKNHTISLDVLDMGKARVSIDGFRSNWLEEGQSETIRQVEVHVVEVFFQTHDGGRREISYEIK